MDDEDDGVPWAWERADGSYVPIPKRPLLLAGYKAPPFDVTLAGRDEIRHIVVDPTYAAAQGAAMSGNQPVEDPPEDVGFPTIGDYEVVPGPGEEGYIEPPPESEPDSEDTAPGGEVDHADDGIEDVDEDGPIDDC